MAAVGELGAAEAALRILVLLRESRRLVLTDLEHRLGLMGLVVAVLTPLVLSSLLIVRASRLTLFLPRVCDMLTGSCVSSLSEAW